MIRRFHTSVFVVSVLVVAACATPDRPLQLVSGDGPVYPADARKNGLEGDVLVQYDVSADGRVVRARVVSSEPPELFDDAALAAVRSWRYVPARRGGKVVAVENVTSRVRFRLGDTARYDRYDQSNQSE